MLWVSCYRGGYRYGHNRVAGGGNTPFACAITPYGYDIFSSKASSKQCITAAADRLFSVTPFSTGLIAGRPTPG
jgi:hypothetical protein